MNKVNFKVYSEKEYDRIFEELKKIPSNWSPKRITKEIQKKLTLSVIPMQQLTSDITDKLHFYRIRTFDKGGVPIDENNLSSFGYPPKSKCKMLRANRKGQQVLYTSTDYHTPFHEMKDDIKVDSTIVYLTKWRIKKLPVTPVLYRSIFLGMEPGDEKNYSSILINYINERVSEQMGEWQEENMQKLFLYGQKKYTELFISKDKQFYHLTSSYIYDSFVYAIKQDLNVPMVLYPSVAKDNSAVNAVFRKDFVDEFMEISEVYKLVVTELSDETIRTTLLKKAIVINGKIEWQRLVIDDLKVNYDGALVASKIDPGKLRKLDSNERLIVCCEDHKITVKQFLENNKVSEDAIKRNLSHTSLDANIDEIPEKIEQLLMAKTSGNVYVDSDTSKEGLIDLVAVPFSYSLKYA